MSASEAAITPASAAIKTASAAMFTICGFVWLFGIIGNALLILTYKRKGLDVRFNQLMVTLAVFDISFLLTTPFVLWLFKTDNHSEVGFEFLWNTVFILNQLALKGSIFTTIGKENEECSKQLNT